MRRNAQRNTTNHKGTKPDRAGKKGVLCVSAPLRRVDQSKQPPFQTALFKFPSPGVVSREEPKMVKLASYLTGHVMESLRRLICAIRGHEDYLQFEKNRVYLQCISCGHESPGWTVDTRRPVLRFQSRRVKTASQGLMRKIA
jgi:hypothetical protein